MKIRLAVLLLVLAGSLFAQQQNTPPGTPGQIKDELIHIEHEIGRANLQCDYRYFDRIEAEEFIFTDASGNVSNKRQDLAGEKIAINPTLNMTSTTLMCVFIPHPPLLRVGSPSQRKIKKA